MSFIQYLCQPYLAKYNKIPSSKIKVNCSDKQILLFIFELRALLNILANKLSLINLYCDNHYEKSKNENKELAQVIV